MKKRVSELRSLLFLLSFLLVFQAFGQEVTVSGRVTDADNGSVMPYVTVAEIGRAHV